MTRPRGFVAIPGDAFDDEDDADRETPFRRLLSSEAFWLGVGFSILFYGSIFLLDSLVAARWAAVIAWGAILTWVASGVRRRWRRWKATP